MIKRAADKIDDVIDFISFSFKKIFNLFKPVIIKPYLGFGTENFFYVKGRVLEDKNITKSEVDESRFRHFKRVVKKFNTYKIKDAHVKIKFHNETEEAITDKEGYFEFNFSFKQKDEIKFGWNEADLELIRSPVNDIKYETTCDILIPPPDADFGIISDIDDTIIETGATNFISAFKNTFLKNPHSRLPFDGVKELYKALHSGYDEKNLNPVFYVSSGPWNIHDLIVQFMHINEIPLGPLMMQDFGIDRDKIIYRDHLVHKLEQVEKIVSIFPEMKFILIGDSGQKDAEIYQRVIQDFPGKILAVYIRDVSQPSRSVKIKEIFERELNHSVPMLLIKDSYEAAHHAFKNKFISRNEFQEIEELFKNVQF
jgi:phosphatidate phosphatase APP1